MPHLLIKAGPGTGKSYTIKSALSYLHLEDKSNFLFKMSDEQKNIYEWCCDNLPRSKSVVYLAFQKTIAEKLKGEVLDFAEVYSLHGFGYSCCIQRWGFQKYTSSRGANLVNKIVGRSLFSLPSNEKFKWLAILKYLEKLKQEDLIPCRESFQLISEKYPELSKTPMPKDIEAAKELFNLMAIPNRQLEFADQIWLGGKALQKPRYDIAFVDEFQDLSAAMLKLALKSAHNIVFCGDPHQSITHFAGAGEDIYEELKERCAEELPLTLSFRVPPNIAAKANTLRPARLRSLPEKEPGIEARLSFDEFVSKVDPSWMVLSRTNAVLISVCLRLLRSGVKAVVAKTDVFKQIEYFIKDCYKANSIPKHIHKLLDTSKGSDTQMMVLQDKCGIVMELWNAFAPKTAEQMIEHLNGLFESEGDPIHLMTIHKAKGLEATTVAILAPPIRHPLAKTEVAIEQEINLEFVATTRTKRDLYWVNL